MHDTFSDLNNVISFSGDNDDKEIDLCSAKWEYYENLDLLVSMN